VVYFTLLGLDPTVPRTLASRIELATQEVVPAFPSWRYYTFDRLDFFHAVLELRTNPVDHDIYHYLFGLLGFFDRLVPSPNLCLPNREADFKKRASEDFGVGLANLLIVRSFNLPWNAVTQVLALTSMKRRPDFIASAGDMTIVFETKGTTLSSKLVTNLRRGKEQLQAYRDPNALRICFSSYIPCQGDMVAPHVVCADPAFDMSETIRIAERLKDQYVLMRLLDFSNLQQTSQQVRTALVRALRRRVEPLPTTFDRRTYHQETETSVSVESDGEIFICRKLAFNDMPGLILFLGASQGVTESLMQREEPHWPKDGVAVDSERRTITSRFSDGSILQLASDNTEWFMRFKNSLSTHEKPGRDLRIPREDG
jgi:hypothetical protein